MSAYIVEKEHIDYLLSVAMRLAAPPHGPFSWSAPDVEPEGVYERGSPWGPLHVEHAKLTRRELDRQTADAVGMMLLEQNYISVGHRYDEEPWQQEVANYEFKEWRGKVDPVQVLKSVSCYEYQACEGPSWAGSEAKAFCDALQHYAIGALPGYDKAEWGTPGVPQ